ncbi:hypothetical protein COCMIDRAFT_30380 [Bipolaris oryzae ATCC 44560]|uniref:Uncharacterized protein n=1 Tax=Bipolaris oryzae ATCC 44560 TaxID=930090 RepID=W6ZAJ9_COCMI|nr:uncharacterized protein COCMIDRAFT_30380 [Bipolaris oryzae ATCC 44560]EUC40731.1 hypothetical protein COCMIDRAFT_30380 [Bipolaris oryzae ATCC 44560]
MDRTEQGSERIRARTVGDLQVRWTERRVGAKVVGKWAFSPRVHVDSIVAPVQVRTELSTYGPEGTAASRQPTADKNPPPPPPPVDGPRASRKRPSEAVQCQIAACCHDRSGCTYTASIVVADLQLGLATITMASRLRQGITVAGDWRAEGAARGLWKCITMRLCHDCEAAPWAQPQAEASDRTVLCTAQHSTARRSAA